MRSSIQSLCHYFYRLFFMLWFYSVLYTIIFFIAPVFLVLIIRPGLVIVEFFVFYPELTLHSLYSISRFVRSHLTVVLLLLFLNIISLNIFIYLFVIKVNVVKNYHEFWAQRMICPTKMR